MRTKRSEATSDTRTLSLDVAERLVQTRGFNGFSYADVAAEVGVTTASLHYHFAGKAELGSALIERYSERFFEALARIDGAGGGARDRIHAFAAIYADVLRDNRMCLCGMLAADYETLAAPMQAAVVRFFDEIEAWLAAVIQGGIETGELRSNGSPQATAGAVVGGLEGAMLVARPYRDVERFEGAARRLIDTLVDDGSEARA